MLDCSGLNINDTKRLPPSLEWVKFLDLSRNEITTINATELLATFPYLQFLSILNNPNFDCQLVKEKRFVVASDCKLESSTSSSITFKPPRPITIQRFINHTLYLPRPTTIQRFINHSLYPPTNHVNKVRKSKRHTHSSHSTFLVAIFIIGHHRSLNRICFCKCMCLHGLPQI